MDPHREEKLAPILDVIRVALGHNFVNRDVCQAYAGRALYRVGFVSQQHQVFLSLGGQVAGGLGDPAVLVVLIRPRSIS